MGKFTGVLLASDFDNTLIYTEAALRAGVPTPPLSEKNRAALEHFMAEGGRFTIATGRALPSVSKLAPTVPMNAPCVVCNGAALYDFERGEYLATAMLDGDVRQRAQSVLDAFPEIAVEAYHVDNVIHAVQPNEVTRRHEHLTKVGITETPTMLDVPLPLGKLMFEGPHEMLEEVLAFIRAQSWAEEYELIFSGAVLLEMTAKGANKGGMVRRLAEELGISMEHVYCAGDEANDLSMLEAAAVGFAPANCAAVVRQSEAVIVSDAREDAMADIIAVLDELYEDRGNS